MYHSVQRTEGNLETNVAHSCLESLLITRKQWVGVCGWQSSEQKRLIPICLPMLKCSFWLDSILEKKLISSSTIDIYITETSLLHTYFNMRLSFHESTSFQMILLPKSSCAMVKVSVMLKCGAMMAYSDPSDMFDSCIAADSLSKGTIACMIYSCVLDYAFTRS
ncbi:unnamed protein product [Sphagnum compactum]